ncbi:MAG: alpha/beta hydrolase [Clostridia bacterium]|nr:alpha/beta hydrolase [Clostridia bacterium]
MKTKTKLIVGALSGVAATFALSKTLDKLVDEHLHRDGIAVIKHKLMTKKNREDFASNPEVNLGKLFHASTPQTELSILNREGRTINALLFKQENESKKYVIIVHGYRASVKSVSYLSKRYFEAGYNVLLPYLRAHLGSDYEYSTMGWYERFDIVDWINHINRTELNAKIVLHGVSMGAATILMTTGEKLPKNVICAIEDCGYTSVYDAYTYKIPKMMKLPAFPFINIFKRTIKRRTGFDIKEASALEQVKKSKTPTLFIHGDADTVVPVEMAKILYKNASCEKELLITRNANHEMSALLYPDKYWGTIWNFIKKFE